MSTSRVTRVTVDGRTVVVKSADTARVLNVGPAGADGADGAAGADGSPGTNGTDGTDGASAYGVAVADGFSGTEAEWLASLVGPQGDPGTDGAGVVATVEAPLVLTGDVLSLDSSGFDTAGAAAAAQAASQPLDSDLTAIAALTTTSFGRALLALADAAAGRTALALGTAAVAATGDFDATGAAAAAQAASQPLDSDLTAIAALTTTSFGRSVLTQADAAALRTLAGLVLGTDVYSKSAVDAGFQPLDSDLTAIAALTTTSYGRSVLATANAAALRTLAGVVIGTDVQAQDAELAAIAGLTSAADSLPYFTGSGTAALTTLSSFIRTLLDDANAAAARTTLGVDATGTAVLKTLYDANTILAATTDDTPAALTVAASTVLGRKATGDIAAMSVAEAQTLLGITASTLGTLGSSIITANQSSISTSGADLTNGAVTVTVAAGRRVRVSFFLLASGSTSGALLDIFVKEGATQLAAAQAIAPASNNGVTIVGSVILTPSTGSHTYKLNAVPSVGTLSVVASATIPAYILCEDIGV